MNVTLTMQIEDAVALISICNAYITEQERLYKAYSLKSLKSIKLKEIDRAMEIKLSILKALSNTKN